MITIKPVGKYIHFIPKIVGLRCIAIPLSLKEGTYYQLTYTKDPRKDVVVAGDKVAGAIVERGLVGKTVEIQEVEVNLN